MVNIIFFFFGKNEEQSNQLHNFTKWVVLPDSLPIGPGVITASLFSLYGASKNPFLSTYTVPVTFGSVTSDNYVSSQGA
jgi:hypothetical protein